MTWMCCVGFLGEGYKIVCYLDIDTLESSVVENQVDVV